ncbi:uncharacterized protein LOC111312533 isoform X2 [Durio zibethinus]|uniref:Uncharacterized protein LOC111312533 isoform X2 n=1 Tax=Durio zibethinus TaxID=66656 RepID=A0A6P6AUP4_DURZI|nr:uncharacterized protein LOC111312533 isoform X2 [Durio zibethinus]
MSWLGRSLANSLRLDDGDNESASSGDEENDVVTHESQSSPPPRHKIQNEETKVEQQSLSPEQVAELQSRGVKEDLTELKQTLTRQLWGVASFLAPPPPPSSHSSAQFNGQSNNRSFSNLNQSEPSDQSFSGDEEHPSDSAAAAGIMDDLTEIGGRLSKMASDYFPFGSGENEDQNEMENENDEEEEDQEFNAVGITDEVLAFARNIAHHPETWLDFPLDPDEDLDDFDMSVTQREHSMAIEHLAPRLAALRIELCPCHISDSYFWKVYFVLLHPRLNKNDAEMLSTPQVVEARALWMKELQKQTKPETNWYGSTSRIVDSSSIALEDLIPSQSSYFAFETMSPRTYVSEPASSITTDYETEKHLIESNEMPFVDKSVIEEKPVSNTEDRDCLVGSSSKILIPNFEDDEIDWPEDDDSVFGGYSGAAIFVENEEDISFSDLEDIDDSSTPTKSKIVSKVFETSKT